MEEHPSMDSLRAFAADALGRDERRRVLEHLIACEGCRGSLALMTPEEGPPVLVAVANQHSQLKASKLPSRKSSK